MWKWDWKIVVRVLVSQNAELWRLKFPQNISQSLIHSWLRSIVVK